MPKTVLIFSLLGVVLLFGIFPVAGHPLNAQQASLTIVTPAGESIAQLTDGDIVKLRIQLPQEAAQPTLVRFVLAGNRDAVADCTVGTGETTCESTPRPALGWYWDDNQKPLPTRLIRAATEEPAEIASTVFTVQPRPVVFVHGFGATWEAWQSYLGNDGYLARVGLQGYAVGDGQAQGRMNTGNLPEPTQRTNTIAENADIVGTYIEQVKADTGASSVDLVAHSMGGLISRYYIARVMEERDVAQLIMLGSPQQGTGCANLPASLDFHLPATLELRPGYVRDIFNQQITERHGIPFYVLAGTPILSAIQSPCSDIPSDIVISRGSAGGIPAEVSEMPVLHTDLNTSEIVFTDFLLPLFQKPASGKFMEETVSAPVSSAEDAIQFTQVFTGNVAAGGSTSVTIQIDAVSVANFALFDPTQSLTMTVRGASGNVIQLDPTKHGLVVINDPETLVHLGYGFNNPLPGPWQLTIQSTARTPANGADYALTALLHGGARLLSSTSQLLPTVGDAIVLTARLEVGGATIPIQEVQAHIHRPDGGNETVSLQAEGDYYQASWSPNAPGLYAIDITATGVLPDGTPLERSQFLAVEAQAPESQPEIALWMLAGGVAVLFIAVVGIFRTVRRRARR